MAKAGEEGGRGGGAGLGSFQEHQETKKIKIKTKINPKFWLKQKICSLKKRRDYQSWALAVLKKLKMSPFRENRKYPTLN